jgi:hypothetical protein
VALERRAKRIDQAAIVAQRMKRFSSVMAKLRREPKMKLSQMHDLGGCRAIVATTRDVRRLFSHYDQPAHLFPAARLPKVFDYIRYPKEDGYRGIHIAARYQAKGQSGAAWNGQRIEIQLRSRLQHAFSTAVETATTFTGMPLKFGGGSSSWRRFFALIGTAIAMREESPPVPGTPTDSAQLISELRGLTNSLKVRALLTKWSDALRQLPSQSTTDARWFILALDTRENTIKVTGFAEARKATEEYGKIEQRRGPGLDTVLVSGVRLDQLRSAYPNYYSDTHDFIAALDEALQD